MTAQEPFDKSQSEPEKSDLAAGEIQAEVKTLLSWHAPGRPFRKRSKEYYLSVLLIMLLIEIILFLFSQYVLMAVVLSLVFVAFALATVPPRDFYYKISVCI
jgi:flagellar biosynthesis protein FliP